eukprot:1158127-Pelagomonas_calceolata.AAC.8
MLTRWSKVLLVGAQTAVCSLRTCIALCSEHLHGRFMEALKKQRPDVVQMVEEQEQAKQARRAQVTWCPKRWLKSQLQWRKTRKSTQQICGESHALMGVPGFANRLVCTQHPAYNRQVASSFLFQGRAAVWASPACYACKPKSFANVSKACAL